ncbi:hypothetical protein Tco_0935124 [Tanacetum coccineum]
MHPCEIDSISSVTIEARALQTETTKVWCTFDCRGPDHWLSILEVSKKVLKRFLPVVMILIQQLRHVVDSSLAKKEVPKMQAFLESSKELQAKDEETDLQGKKEVPVNAWLFREYEELQSKKKKRMKEFLLLKAKFQELNENSKARFELEKEADVVS